MKDVSAPIIKTLVSNNDSKKASSKDHIFLLLGSELIASHLDHHTILRSQKAKISLKPSNKSITYTTYEG